MTRLRMSLRISKAKWSRPMQNEAMQNEEEILTMGRTLKASNVA